VEVGDVLSCEGSYYIVACLNTNGSAIILSKDEERLVNQDDAFYSFVCHPLRDWAYVQIPKSLYSLTDSILSVSVPTTVLSGLQYLKPYEEWVIGEPYRKGVGGNLYLSPKLKLRHWDRVIILTTAGRSDSIVIPKNFLPVGTRSARSKLKGVKKKVRKTVFDYLIQPDEDEE